MRAISFLIIGLLLMVSGCKENSMVPAEVFDRAWYNTYEKEQEGFFRFTPVPKGQGWQYEGFRLNTDGTFVEYGIGPADAAETRPGTWKAAGKQAYKIQFEDAQRQGYTLYLRSVSHDVLKARREE